MPSRASRRALSSPPARPSAPAGCPCCPRSPGRSDPPSTTRRCSSPWRSSIGETEIDLEDRCCCPMWRETMGDKPPLEVRTVASRHVRSRLVRWPNRSQEDGVSAVLPPTGQQPTLLLTTRPSPHTCMPLAGLAREPVPRAEPSRAERRRIKARAHFENMILRFTCTYCSCTALFIANLQSATKTHRCKPMHTF